MTALLESGGALATVAVLLRAPTGGERATGRVELSRAAGTLSLANSREGAAIFQADGMRPGQQATGWVRVTNTGTLAATLAPAPGRLSAADAPSQALAGRLELTVLDVIRRVAGC